MSSDIPQQQATVADKIPDPSTFGKRLFDTVDYLSNQDNNALTYHEEHNPLEKHRSKLEDIDFDDDNWEFELTPPWEVVLGQVNDERDQTGMQRPDFENAKGYAQIAGEVNVVNGDFEQYSFSLCLLSQRETEGESTSDTDDETFPCCWADADRRWRVARRLHFDIDTGDNEDEQKPMAHLQVGGETPHTRINYTGERYHYCDSSLDKPRIPYPPTDPVMLLHMLIRQYPGISSADSESWQDKVKLSENLLSRKYHGYVKGVYSRDSRDPLLSYLSNSTADN
jgi:hypothetical protein